MVTREWGRVMTCGAAIHSIVSLPKAAAGRAFIRQLIFVGAPRGDVIGHRYIQPSSPPLGNTWWSWAIQKAPFEGNEARRAAWTMLSSRHPYCKLPSDK